MSWRIVKGKPSFPARPKGTPRPKRCRECHVPATHVEYTTRPETRITMTGDVLRSTWTTAVYYCKEHTGIS